MNYREIGRDQRHPSSSLNPWSSRWFIAFNSQEFACAPCYKGKWKKCQLSSGWLRGRGMLLWYLMVLWLESKWMPWSLLWSLIIGPKSIWVTVMPKKWQRKISPAIRCPLSSIPAFQGSNSQAKKSNQIVWWQERNPAQNLQAGSSRHEALD